MNRVCLMGRLCRSPELKCTEKGTPVVSVTIAVDRKSQDNKTDFIPITAFKGTAEFIYKYFSKGNMIALEGTLVISRFETKDGISVSRPEVIAEHVFFTGERAAPAPSMEAKERISSLFDNLDTEAEGLPVLEE